MSVMATADALDALGITKEKRPHSHRLYFDGVRIKEVSNVSECNEWLREEVGVFISSVMPGDIDRGKARLAEIAEWWREYEQDRTKSRGV